MATSYRNGPSISNYSRIKREADEWRKKRVEEDNLTPLDQNCRCGKLVEGPRYMRQRSCRVCGKFIKGGKV